jgi:hypothetical protein
MGRLLYGPAETQFAIDDRTLEHLRMVILNKFRRNEPFALQLHDPEAEGSGRDVIWLHPAIPVRFRFDAERAPALDRAWVESLILASYDAGGLRLTSEPAPESLAKLSHLSAAR